jgi:mannose-6-phosphate isomerase
MMELSCPVQTYAWGRKGLDSAVAALKAASDSSFAVEEVTPYAELWMGTHPNGPAVLKHTGKNLKEVIEADAEAILGQRVVQEFGGKDLPFLFKVLSVNKALSIQVTTLLGSLTKLNLGEEDFL